MNYVLFRNKFKTKGDNRMVFRPDIAHLDRRVQAIINDRDERDKLLKESSKDTTQIINSNKKENEAKEKLKQEAEKAQKNMVIGQLEFLDKGANELMVKIANYLISGNIELREEIKLGLKSIKEKLEIESKKYNKAKYYCRNQFERNFYKPAIRDCWGSISSFQFSRKPCQDMYNKVHDIADYAQHYLSQLKDSAGNL